MKRQTKQNEMEAVPTIIANLSGSSPWHGWAEVHVAMDTQFFEVFECQKLTLSGRSKQASKQASKHVYNAVILVWGLLRFAPKREELA